MKPRLLDFLVCPNCGAGLELEEYRVIRRDWDTYGSSCTRHGGGQTAEDDSLCPECYSTEIVEGMLRCSTCNSVYPVIEGVPRVLEPALLACIRDRYERFFTLHSDVLGSIDASVSHPLAATLASFTAQRLDLAPPDRRFARQWRDHLRKMLGPDVPLSALNGQTIVDIGAGFGRHLHAAAEQGAEIIGVDLSGGVQLAWSNTLRWPRVHVVQADLFSSPLRAGEFDTAWSFGVLHHLPDPRAGFRSLVNLARADSGLVAIWVYGYEGMALTYRLSHLRPVRRALANTGPGTRLAVSRLVAAILSLAYWEPLSLLARLGFVQRVRRLPVSEQANHTWSARVAAVHDRLGTPITHYLDREALATWFGDAQLADVVIADTNRRGWRASGRRRGP